MNRAYKYLEVAAFCCLFINIHSLVDKLQALFTQVFLSKEPTSKVLFTYIFQLNKIYLYTMSSSENIGLSTPQRDPRADRSPSKAELVAFKKGTLPFPRDWACPLCAQFKKQIIIHPASVAMCLAENCTFFMDPAGGEFGCSIWICDCCALPGMDPTCWLNWISDRKGDLCGLDNCEGPNCMNFACRRPQCGRLAKKEGDGSGNNNSKDDCNARLGPEYLPYNGGYLVYNNQERAKILLMPWICKYCLFYNEGYTSHRTQCGGCGFELKFWAIFVVKRDKTEEQKAREKKRKRQKTSD
jgi:hypothetical protein